LALLLALLGLLAADGQTWAQDPTPTPARSTLLVADAFVRAGPGEFFTPVGQVTPASPLVPVNLSPDGQWVLIRYNRGFGWLRRDLAVWVVNLDSLPTLEPNLTPTPSILTNTPFFPTNTPSQDYIRTGAVSAYVRGGPGRTFLRLGQVYPGDTLEPVGRNADTSWVLVRFAGSESGFGWLRRDLGVWFTDLAALPVVDENNLTPTPTFTASATPSITPTATATATPTSTPTDTPTLTPEPSATPTDTPTLTPEPSATPTDTPTLTPEPSATPTDTPTLTPEPSATPTDTPTLTPEPSATSTDTPTLTPEPSATPTDTPTLTPEPSATPTDTPTLTPEPSATSTNTPTLTPEPSATVATTQQANPPAQNTSTHTPAPTIAPSETPAPTIAPSETPAPTIAPSETPAPTIAPSETPAPTVAPSETPAPTDRLTVTPEQTSIAAVITVTPAPPTLSPTDAPAPTPPAPSGGLGAEALAAGLIFLAILGYLFAYLRGAAGAKRYASGFVIETCPICRTGHLTVEARTERSLGIPSTRHVVKCDTCRSILRETGNARWRYAVDRSANPALYDKLNNRELREDTLKRLLESPSDTPTPITPPGFVDDDKGR
jgi:hypothetical protein